MIDYFPNGELGGDADLLRQAQKGYIAIMLCQTAPVVSFIPEVAVFDLPMVFARYNGDVIDLVLNGDSQFHQKISEAYEKAGLHLLGFMQNATYRLATANKDLETLTDFNGQLSEQNLHRLRGQSCISPCRTARSTLRRTLQILA